MSITGTLFGQVIAFILLIWLVNRFLWGPLSAMMANRQKRIADGLAAAEKGRNEQELGEKRAREVLHTARIQAAEILAQAEKRAVEIVEEAKGVGRTEGARLVSAAHTEITSQVNHAREQLRSQVVAIAMSGAEKILGREIDAKANNDLLQQLVAQI